MKNIKIVSGWSETGGSTEVFIELTNQFNKIGYDCTFFGPHDYHLNKCKSNHIKNIGTLLNGTDILICHFMCMTPKPPIGKIIFSCHEKEVFDFKKIQKFWDVAVFLNEEQRAFHDYKDKYEIIPNLRKELTSTKKSHLDKVAGIIGSIDPNKQVHVSIERALKDGCEKVILFGSVRDPKYFETFIRPLLGKNVIFPGFCTNKQKMYDSVGRVYNSSLSEVASLVKDECKSTGTLFFGLESTDTKKLELSNKEILDKWETLFKTK